MSTKHLSNRIDALSGMDLDAVRKEFTSVMGRPTNSKDKESMIQQIGERLLHGAKVPAATIATAAATTEKAKGKAKRAPATTDTKASPFTADPRLPAPGSTIKVTHKKKDYECKFLGADGYEYEGERFRSLSAVASKILGGVAVNGFLWWGLIKRPATDAKPATTEAPAKEPAAPKAKRAKAKKPARKGAKPAAKKS